MESNSTLENTLVNIFEDISKYNNKNELITKIADQICGYSLLCDKYFSVRLERDRFVQRNLSKKV